MNQPRPAAGDPGRIRAAAGAVIGGAGGLYVGILSGGIVLLPWALACADGGCAEPSDLAWNCAWIAATVLTTVVGAGVGYQVGRRVKSPKVAGAILGPFLGVLVIMSPSLYQIIKPDLLRKAVESGNVVQVETLLARKADVSRSSGVPLLTEAANSGNLPIVEALVKAGANVNAQTEDGDTALSELCGMSGLPPGADIAIANYLIASGANVNLPIDRGGALLRAVQSNNAPIVELLIKAGANIETRDDQYTPLMLAMSAVIVKDLVAAGADLKAKDKQGESAFSIIAKRGFKSAALQGLKEKRRIP